MEIHSSAFPYCDSNSSFAWDKSPQIVCISGIVSARTLFKPASSPLCSLLNEYRVNSYIFTGKSLYEITMSCVMRNWPKHAENRKKNSFSSDFTTYWRAGKRFKYFLSDGCS
ncbi:Uncharacterised protein [uncultured archaeon]|nr:Uncharacterised protein [uncultured archaeon]